MKSLFSRFKPATAGPSSSRPSLDASASTSAPDRSDDTVKVSKSRSFRRARLPEHPPQPPQHPETPTSTSGEHSHHYSSASHSSAKELPPRPITPGGLAQLAPPLPPKDHEPNPIEEWRANQQAAHADNVKKVAFQSPQRPYTVNSESDLRARAGAGAPGHGQFHGGHGLQPRDRDRSPTPNAVRGDASRSSSRNSMHGGLGGAPLGMRRGSASTSQVSLAHSPIKSTLSTLTLAPSESSVASAQSYIPLPESWSAAMDDELIANLGPRERARQEVLWEIVNSEERYVQDLAKLNETFCIALLPQREAEPLGLPDPLGLTRTTSFGTSSGSHELQDFLPIASQYSAKRQSTDSYRSDDDAAASGARMNALAALTKGSSMPPQPQHASHSLNSRPSQSNSNSHSHGQSSSRSHSQPRSLPLNRNSRGSLGAKGEGHSRITSRSSISSVLDGPVTLPDDLEQVLTVIASGILDGHVKLVGALRKRYDEQFPLVRSLADVFTSHSDILREYATYIMHLERALAQIDEAAAMAGTIGKGSRRSSRRLEETQLGRLSKTIQGLEELAAQRGEAGLAISLSKPFQRLLKYPLLFQNLLFNTSPSTREYEATLAMVDEVQAIVRSIEDEKSSFEERERARDAWARIEGIERNKVLMAPKPTRLLVSETLVPAKEKKGKSSHRLSEMLKHRNSEQWIVRFTDVSLLCERTGYTSLPMSTTKGAGFKSESQTDLTKRMSSSKRNQSLKQRNMYRFIKVLEWHERAPKPETPPPRLSLDYKRTSLDVMRRASVDHYRRPSLDHHPTLDNLLETPRATGTGSAVTPRKVPMKTVDGSPSKLTPRRRAGSPTRTDDAQSEVMSVMSFAFRGEARPLASGRYSSLGARTGAATTRATKTMSMAERRSSTSMGSMPSAAANAKFAHRLRSSDELATAPTVRPASRVRRSLPPAMAITPSIRSRTTTPAQSQRPPWNSSMRPMSVREEREASLPLSSAKVRPKASAPAARPSSAAARSRSSASEREPLADAANQKTKVPSVSDKSEKSTGKPASLVKGKSAATRGRGSDVENAPSVATTTTATTTTTTTSNRVEPARTDAGAGAGAGAEAKEEVVLDKTKTAPAIGLSRTNVEVVVDKPAGRALTGVAAKVAALERNFGGRI